MRTPRAMQSVSRNAASNARLRSPGSSKSRGRASSGSWRSSMRRGKHCEAHRDCFASWLSVRYCAVDPDAVAPTCSGRLRLRPLPFGAVCETAATKRTAASGTDQHLRTSDTATAGLPSVAARADAAATASGVSEHLSEKQRELNKLGDELRVASEQRQHALEQQAIPGSATRSASCSN